MSTGFYRPTSRALPNRKRRRGPVILATLGIVLATGASFAGFTLLRKHPRFLVKRIVFDGVPDSRRAEAEALTDRWIGQPLLFTDVDGPLATLSSQPWVARAAARRIVPDTITVTVTARPPVALARRGDELWTVDRAGTFLGPYSGRLVGRNDSFVIIDPGELSEAMGVEKGAAFLEALKGDDPALLARVSEVRVLLTGFAVVDSEARARLLFGPDAVQPGRAAPIWRAFLALRPELSRHALPLTTADLRFEGRIVLPQPAGDGGKT